MLINAILNSLRFPCVQTYAYSNLFQELFYNIKDESIKEHMLNNLLIRMIYKPLPWGVCYTFVILNKVEKYQKVMKPFIDKYNLNDIIKKIINGYKKKDLVNLV